MISFEAGDQINYDALPAKDPDTLYFVEDTGRIYKGDILMTSAADSKLAFETGQVETLNVYASSGDYKMVGTYQLVGDFCIIAVTAHTIENWRICYYPLPVPAIHPSQIIAYGNVTLEIKTNSQNDRSVLSIENIDYDGSNNMLPGGTVSFTMCYKYKDT